MVIFKNVLETCHPYSNNGYLEAAIMKLKKIHCKRLLSKLESMPMNFKNSTGQI